MLGETELLKSEIDADLLFYYYKYWFSYLKEIHVLQFEK